MNPSTLKLYFFVPLAFLLLTLSALSYSQTLRVGTTLWPGYEPLYLAEEINAYKSDIRLINYPSTSEVLRAFKNHTLEAAALTLDEVILLSESGTAIDIILILDISEGADVIMGHPELVNMQGLIGAKVAVESTAVGAYTLSRALEMHNIDIQDISLVNAVLSSHKESYTKKLADAVVTFEPVRTQLLNQGAIELFSSKEIPGEILDVLVVHKNTINTHKEQLYDIAKGWFKGLQQIKKSPNASYRFIASRLKLTEKEVKDSYLGLSLPSLSENKKLMTGSPAPLSLTLDRLTQHMIDTNLLDSGATKKTTINTMFLP
jgi:NitT/TauT family transport system substrate-binding protein